MYKGKKWKPDAHDAFLRSRRRVAKTSDRCPKQARMLAEVPSVIRCHQKSETLGCCMFCFIAPWVWEPPPALAAYAAARRLRFTAALLTSLDPASVPGSGRMHRPALRRIGARQSRRVLCVLEIPIALSSLMQCHAVPCALHHFSFCHVGGCGQAVCQPEQVGGLLLRVQGASLHFGMRHVPKGHDQGGEV